MGYETVKTVRVNDRCLGSVRFALLTMLTIYLFWTFCFYEYLHLEKEVPIGGATVTLQQKDPECIDDGNSSCLRWGDSVARFPQGESNAFTVSTYVYDRNKGEDSGSMVENVEQFEIKIEHHFESPGFYTEGKNKAKYSGSNIDYDGELEYRNDEAKVTHSKKFSKGTPIILKISDLLEAAGHAPNLTEDEKKNGMVLSISVKYNRLHRPFHSEAMPSWKMQVTHVPGQTHSVKQSIFVGDQDSLDEGDQYDILHHLKENTRVLVRKNLHVEFTFGGTIGRFSKRTCFDNFLLQLVTLALITTILDFFLMYCPWTSKNFFNIKYEETDFNVIEHLKAKGDTKCPPLERPSIRRARIKDEYEAKIHGIETDVDGKQVYNL